MKTIQKTEVFGILLAILLAGYANGVWAFAPADSLEKRARTSKAERIRQAVFNDTTEALANLFLAKRSMVRKTNRVVLIAGAASAAIFLTGGLLAQEAGTPYSPDFIVGFPMVFTGAVGILTSGVVAGVNNLRLNPYTLRKYEKLVAMQRSGIPLPEFYARRVSPYLR